jgi:choline dehydrogenase-like flavoprotein
MALNRLISVSNQPVPVQETDFTIDGVGRYVCNTFEEATGNGGPPFNVVVIGAGAYGAYCAAKIHSRHPAARVLVLEAGSFLVAEHIQNLGRMGLNVAGEIPPASDPGVPRELVWGLPWRGNVDFPGLAYCAGGKSLYWGGWCPRLTGQDLAAWPVLAADYLNATYADVESETGVVPGADFIFGELHDVLLLAASQASAGVANIETGLGVNGVHEAPLAVQGNSPVSGLFSFDKYSSLPLLLEWDP